ncbi:alpha/beta hydrolase [Dictyobacter formicarum]|uniref:Esterase n=1 Tax=Dictyobacter formicarum TaxID=2778368 RepID=A0ABQ3VMI1_9CHLR|nr:alpha/beta hydrolase [Dictyobacter formicarum]GHO87000.1 esterase [Dictyobacter formicarum]
MTNRIQLEPEAQAFAESVALSPLPCTLGPQQGRLALDEAQSGKVRKPAVDMEDLTIAAGPREQVALRILRPQNTQSPLPVIVYLHGTGWVFGSPQTHDRLVRELAVGAGTAVVFPVYQRSPEVRYPTALEECYMVAQWVERFGQEHGLDAGRLAVAGDSVGGNMATVITRLARERGGPAIRLQLLFYPVTDATFDTASYRQFAEGYSLRRDTMMWFWDQYTPHPGERNEITASPLRASVEELQGLPPALIITAEADVVRDEGEAYANKLRQAGVRVTAVRFQGTIHDFVMLNALAQTAATRGAIALATAWLHEEFSIRLI